MDVSYWIFSSLWLAVVIALLTVIATKKKEQAKAKEDEAASPQDGDWLPSGYKND